LGCSPAEDGFNVSDWSGQLLRRDKRWAYGDPPVGNANYSWIQHFIHHLSPPNGRPPRRPICHGRR
jgi:type I restriction enzyme M protein